METIGIVAAASILAFVVEALLEYGLSIWWKPLEGLTLTRVAMALGLVLGVGLCVAYQVDILSTLGFKAGIVGQIVTGALIGRGSEYWHIIYKRLKLA